MMAALFSYLWQSALVLSVLFIPFQLLLRKEHFIRINRCILLAILLLSLFLPLSGHHMPAWLDFWQHTEPAVNPPSTLDLASTSSQEAESIDKESLFDIFLLWLELHWKDLLLALWMAGTTLFVILQLVSLFRLYRIMHNEENIVEPLDDGNTLYLSLTPIQSFSWMRCIVMSTDDYSESRDTILCHERAHIAHHHSYDRLLLLAVKTLQWWNPFVWLLDDALTQVHEYEADLEVINHGFNASQYQLLLISKAAGPAGLTLVNGFKRNKLKLRIIMMNETNNLRGAKCRYLALLPVMLLAFALTARAQVKVKTTTDDNKKAGVTVTVGSESHDPLVVVEGEVVADMNSIDPNTIASVEVFKGYNEKALEYAEKYEAAKNGVIMVHLKKEGEAEPAQEPPVEYKGTIAYPSEYTGIVVDEKGDPVIGAIVRVEGTTIGTVTGRDGSFKIEVAEGQTLQFAFIGMKTVYAKVGSTKKNNVVVLKSEK